MITKEQFENSYIINDNGDLWGRYVALGKTFGYVASEEPYTGEVTFVGDVTILQDCTYYRNFCNSEHYKRKKPKQLTLEDFKEEGEEEMVEDKKIIQKYIREEFNTRGQALDSYDSGVVFYTPINEGYSVVDETGILDHFGQLFTLEEREETWQDVAQEFIKSNSVFDEDEFLLEMFSDDYSEYHEPMKKLAKIIVEKSGD